MSLFTLLKITRTRYVVVKAGVPARVRQLFGRHPDLRPTPATCDHEAFLDLVSAVRARDGLGLR